MQYFNRLLIFLLLAFICIIHVSLKAQQWISLGPDSTPSLINPKDNSQRFAVGIGRVGMLKLYPDKKTKGEKPRMYLGTPFGGLWEYSETTGRWNPSSTNNLIHIGVSDLAISPKQPMIRYLITADPDCIMDPNGPALSSEYCQSRGIVKSIDGGRTWSDTAIGNWYNQEGRIESDFWKYPSLKIARKLLVDPKCQNRLSTIVYTYSHRSKSYDASVYQSEDSGENWRPRMMGQDAWLKDLEYKPCSRKVMYASGRGVYKSKDAGVNWLHLDKNGLPPDSTVMRIALAFSSSHPKLIYALVIYKNSRNSDIYLSDDDGVGCKKYWIL